MLSLGDVQFAIDELPEHIALGGTHTLVVRKYAGGGKDIQTLGAFDDNIAWDGVLWFENALDRAQTLNDMRIAGDPVVLQIGSMSCKVVINRFKFTYHHDAYIPYEIEMEPAELLTTVGSVNSNTNLQPTSAVSGPGSGAAVQEGSSPADLASGAAAATYSTSQFGAAADTNIGSIISAMSPPVVASQAIQSQLTHLVSAGDSLWSIAAKYYQDGTQWTTIALANAIKNPNGLLTGQQLTIPNPVVTS